MNVQAKLAAYWITGVLAMALGCLGYATTLGRIIEASGEAGQTGALLRELAVLEHERNTQRASRDEVRAAIEKHGSTAVQALKQALADQKLVPAEVKESRGTPAEGVWTHQIDMQFRQVALDSLVPAIAGVQALPAPWRLTRLHVAGTSGDGVRGDVAMTFVTLALAP